MNSPALPSSLEQLQTPARSTLPELQIRVSAHAERRLRRGIAATLGLSGLLVLTAYVAGFDLIRLVNGLPRTLEFLQRLVPPIRADHVISDVREWYWGFGKWASLLGSTLMMALIATTLGTLIGGALSFFASRNLTTSSLAYWLMRRGFELARSVPDLVWALIFVFAFGLGPLPGVLAIAVHTLGAQGKLFAEVNENIDMRPVEGVRASGGSWIEAIIYGVLPQVLPNFVSYSLWRFEINVRSATIIGFVGAGGIGMELYEALRLNYFDDVGAILLIIAATVMTIDVLSEWLRGRLTGQASFDQTARSVQQ